MGLNYDATGGIRQRMSIKSESEKTLSHSKEFPECVGSYPDCPEKPSLLDRKCRNCPQAEHKNIPKLEWVDCEHCKEEEMVPFDTNSSIDKNENTKCHNCGKENSAEWIKKQRGK